MVTRLDSAGTLFFNRQLEHLKKKNLEVQYPLLKARTLIPMSEEQVPEYADTYTYWVYDRVGFAKIIGNYATNLPSIDLVGKQVTAKTYVYGASYSYTIDEIAKAQALGLNLSSKKSEATARACAELENKLAFSGSADFGFTGLFNHPNIPTLSVPNGASASPLWTNKTPDEILLDLNTAVRQMAVNTNDVESANTLLLPIDTYHYVSKTKVSIYETSKSILQTFMDMNPQITDVQSCIELKDYTPGVRAFMLYKKDPSKLGMQVPRDYTEEPPQFHNLAATIPCHAKWGGVEICFPLSLIIGIGI